MSNFRSKNGQKIEFWPAVQYKLIMICVFLEAIHESGIDDCPPACEQMTYEGSLSSVPLSVTNFGESVLRVFFKHSSVIQYKRDQLYSIEDIVGKAFQALLLSSLQTADFLARPTTL